jgi:hypothetical protein
MFTDLVDSTALMTRVGESAAEGLRRDHMAVLRTAIDARGGREVKNLGDGLMVVFTSAADAVAAAVDIQRALHRRNRRAAEPLAVRVGIALGDADVEDDDYFGVPVVQAARLCAQAAGGEVLCTDVVRMLAGSRVDASFEAVGELALKGLTEPVAASRVEWATTPDAEEARLPPRLAVAVTERFVGREAEQERVTSAWKSATSDASSRVVLVSGEPGIGKTTLTARLAAGVLEDGAVVVYGRCDEDLGIPYQPWIEALTQLVAATSDDVLQAHVADRGAHLGRLVSTLSRRTGTEPTAGDGGDSERFVLLGCVVDLLERVCAEAPVLIVLDDLHWADRQSLQVLRHVATSALSAPLLTVGTFRDSDVAAGDPMSDLLAAFHRVATVERIALRGLDDADLLELLERTAGHQMDDQGVALRDAVLAETDGNPFFVNEILRHLAQSGDIYRDDTGRWVGDFDVRSVGLPVSVTEVIGRRVATLGADTERLLTLAAVIGRDFDIDVLATAAGLDPLDVIDLCDAAVAAAVLQPTAVVDRYTFTHALVEHTLYDSMSPSRRARAHRIVAESIETIHGSDPGRAGELAHHWSAAVQPADTAKALHYARLAGDRALEQLAPDDALRWYTHALELLDRAEAPTRARVELLVSLGIAERRCGRAEHRETLLAAARLADELDESDLYVRAVLAGFRGGMSNSGTTDHERIAAINRALELIGDGDTPERVRLLIMAGHEQHFVLELDGRIALFDEAVEIARRLGDPAVLLWALAYGAAAKGPRTVHARSARLAEARQLVDPSSDPDTAFMIGAESRLLAFDLGDREGMRRASELSKASGVRSPEPVRLWNLALDVVIDPILDGDLAEAERLAEVALAIGLDIGQPDAFVVYGGQIANIRHHQGRLHELIPVMEEAFRAAPELHPYRSAIAAGWSSAGDLDTARAMLDDALAGGLDVREDDFWSAATVSWSEVAVDVGHRPAAELLHSRLDPYRDLLVHGIVLVYPAAATVLGMLEHVLGRLDDADRSFAQGDAIHRRMTSPLLIARGEAHWAAMLADRAAPGDLERARSLATSALVAARERGFGNTERVARRVLARLDG